MLVYNNDTLKLKTGVNPRQNTVNYVVCEDLPLFILLIVFGTRRKPVA